jgi:diaminohydroxyphosphoribosylaminopyrimidine deaminase/5-amino-6-(5-phosphoribosylamino)uracil reductase
MHQQHRLEDAMRRALQLAGNGPAEGVNPRVGCVILSPTGDVIAEGWHRGAGTCHAEVDALAQLDPAAARGATAVVTLEPCNHTGRTGPCALALIDAGIGQVVYAVADPGQRSAGGADRLRAAGIDVTGGVLADEAQAFLADWLVAARLGRPFVTLKWATSLDGRAAAADGSSRWITGPDARQDVHERRSLADAILVGTGTALTDDPALTARAPDGTLFPHQPRPVVVGRRSVPDSAAVHRHPLAAWFEPEHDVTQLLGTLYQRGVRRVFVEGGPTLATAFVRAGLVDEYLVYLAPTLLGGDRLALGNIGVAGIDEQRRLRIQQLHRLGDDILLVAAPATAPEPSTPTDLDPRATTTTTSTTSTAEDTHVHRNH